MLWFLHRADSCHCVRLLEPRPQLHASGKQSTLEQQGLCRADLYVSNGLCIAEKETLRVRGCRSLRRTSPLRDIADDSLPSIFYIYVLNRDSLLATMAVFPKRLHLCGEGPGELVERSLVRL